MESEAPFPRARARGSETRFDRWINAARGGLEGVLFVMSKEVHGHKNWSVFGMWFDFMQLMAYPLYQGKSFPWRKMNVMQGVIGILGSLNPSVAADSISPIFKLFSVFAAAAWVAAIVAAAVYSAYSFSVGNFATVAPLKFLRATARLTTAVLFVPLASLLISVYKCRSGESWSVTDMPCYGTEHGLLMAMVSILLPFFWIFSLCVSAVFFDRNYRSSNIVARVHGRVGIAMISLKSLLTLVFTVAADADPWLLHVFVILVGFLWLWLWITFLPNLTQWYNRTWAAFGAVFTWAALCAALARLLDDPKAGVAGYVFLVGIPSAAYTGYALAYMRFQYFGKGTHRGLGPALRSAYDVELRARWMLRDIIAAAQGAEANGEHRKMKSRETQHVRSSSAHRASAPRRLAAARVGVGGGVGGRGLGVGAGTVGSGGTGRGRGIGRGTPATETTRSASPGASMRNVHGQGGLSTRSHMLGRDVVGDDHGKPLKSEEEIIRDVNKLYAEAAEAMPTSSLLSMFYAGFIRVFIGDKDKEMQVLKAGLQKDPSVDIRFLLFQSRKQLEETAPGEPPPGSPQAQGSHGHVNHHGNAGKSGKMSLIERVQFEKLQGDTIDFNMRGRLAELHFWSQLLSKRPSLQQLHSLAEEMSDSIAATTTAFERMLIMRPNSVSVLLNYATFLLEVKRDNVAANRYFDRAEEITVKREAADTAAHQLVVADARAVAEAAAAQAEVMTLLAAQAMSGGGMSETALASMLSSVEVYRELHGAPDGHANEIMHTAHASGQPSSRIVHAPGHMGMGGVMMVASATAQFKRLLGAHQPHIEVGEGQKPPLHRSLPSPVNERARIAALSGSLGSGGENVTSRSAAVVAALAADASAKAEAAKVAAEAVAASGPPSSRSRAADPEDEVDDTLINKAKRRGSVAMNAYATAVSKVRRASLVVSAAQIMTDGAMSSPTQPEKQRRASVTAQDLWMPTRGNAIISPQVNKTGGRSRSVEHSSLSVGGAKGERQTSRLSSLAPPRSGSRRKLASDGVGARVAQAMTGESGLSSLINEKGHVMAAVALQRSGDLEEESTRLADERVAAASLRAKAQARAKQQDAAETAAASLRTAIIAKSHTVEPSLGILRWALTFLFGFAAALNITGAVLQRTLLEAFMADLSLLSSSIERQLAVEDIIRHTHTLALVSAGALSFTATSRDSLNSTYTGLTKANARLDVLNRQLYASISGATVSDAERELYNRPVLEVRDYVSPTLSLPAGGSSSRKVSLANLGVEFVSKAAIVAALPIVNVTVGGAIGLMDPTMTGGGHVNPHAWFILTNGPTAAKDAYNMSTLETAMRAEAHGRVLTAVDFGMALGCFLCTSVLSLLLVIPIVAAVRASTDEIFAIFLALPDSILKQMQRTCKKQIVAFEKLSASTNANVQADTVVAMAMHTSEEDDENGEEGASQVPLVERQGSSYVVDASRRGSNSSTAGHLREVESTALRVEEYEDGSGVLSSSQGLLAHRSTDPIGMTHGHAVSQGSSSVKLTAIDERAEQAAQAVLHMMQRERHNVEYSHNVEEEEGRSVVVASVVSFNTVTTAHHTSQMSTTHPLKSQPSFLELKSSKERVQLIKSMSHALLPGMTVVEEEKASVGATGIIRTLSSAVLGKGSSLATIGRRLSLRLSMGKAAAKTEPRTFETSTRMLVTLTARFVWPLLLLGLYYAGLWAYEDSTSVGLVAIGQSAQYFGQVHLLLTQAHKEVRWTLGSSPSAVSATSAWSCNATRLTTSLRVTEALTATANMYEDRILFGAPGSGIRVPSVQLEPALLHLMLTDGCTGVPNMPSDCAARTGFYHGLVGDGVQPALREFLSLARYSLQIRKDAVSVALQRSGGLVSACPSGPVLNQPPMSDLDGLVNVYLRAALTRVLDVVLTSGRSRVTAFVTGHAAMAAVSVLVLAGLYFTAVLRSIRKMDRDIKRTRGTLLLFPTDVLAGVATFVQMSGGFGSGGAVQIFRKAASKAPAASYSATAAIESTPRTAALSKALASFSPYKSPMQAQRRQTGQEHASRRSDAR